MHSPAWPKTVLLFMYDEHGGYYDHVAPPAAVPPDDIAPDVVATPNAPAAWNQYGLRVPAFVISPFAKRNYVSHVVHDHTSVLRFIETKFNLGALTRRDANADNLLDCLDFHRPAFLEPPTLAAPGPPGDRQHLPAPDPATTDGGDHRRRRRWHGHARRATGATCAVPPPMTDSQDERVKLLEHVRSRAQPGLALSAPRVSRSSTAGRRSTADPGRAR